MSTRFSVFLRKIADCQGYAARLILHWLSTQLPRKGQNMNKNTLNLAFAVMLGVIGTEFLMKKTPVGKMLGLA